MSASELKHIPGYTGAVPGQRHEFGTSFGRATSVCLQDPTKPKSDRNFLYNASISPEKSLRRSSTMEGSTGTMFEDDQRSRSPKSGYAGFVPRRQHYFGKSYQETAIQALDDHDRLQAKQRASRPSTAYSPSSSASFSSAPPSSSSYPSLTRSLPSSPTMSLSPPLMRSRPPSPSTSIYSNGSLGVVERTARPQSTMSYRSDFELTKSPPRPLSPVKPCTVPGYTGHIPLMRENSVARSHAVGATVSVEQMGLSPQQRAFRTNASRTAITDSLKTPIPGFAGHVPLKSEEFGDTYGNITRKSLGNFRDQAQRARRPSDL